MSNVTRFEAGSMQDWNNWSFKHPLLPKAAPGKLFLGEKLGLDGMEVSLNTLPPGRGMPFHHRHRRHEELYLVLAGQGEFQVDGERFAVKEGSAIRIAPAGVRTWRNSGDSPLVYVVIQATQGSLEQQGIEDGEVVDAEVRW